MYYKLSPLLSVRCRLGLGVSIAAPRACSLAMLVLLITGSTPAQPVLLPTGTVSAWGRNDWGQTTVPTALTGVTAIAAGSSYTVALKSDVTVVAWGNPLLTSVPAGLGGVTAIAAGAQHAVALKSDGTVVAWGQSDY